MAMNNHQKSIRTQIRLKKLAIKRAKKLTITPLRYDLDKLLERERSYNYRLALNERNSVDFTFLEAYDRAYG